MKWGETSDHGLSRWPNAARFGALLRTYAAAISFRELKRRGARVSIDAIAGVAQAIAAQSVDWLLAVKANQPSLRAGVDAAFAEAPVLDTCIDLDKGHGRIHRAAPSHGASLGQRSILWRP